MFQGTPSLAEPSTISSVLETVSRLCYLPSGAEVTLEANPTSTETATLRQVHVQEWCNNRSQKNLYSSCKERRPLLLFLWHSCNEFITLLIAVQCSNQARTLFSNCSWSGEIRDLVVLKFRLPNIAFYNIQYTIYNCIGTVD